MTVEIKTLPTLRDVELQLKATFDAAVENLRTHCLAFDSPQGVELFDSIKAKIESDIDDQKFYEPVLQKMALDIVRGEKGAEDAGFGMQSVFDKAQIRIGQIASRVDNDFHTGRNGSIAFISDFLNAAKDVYEDNSTLKAELEEFIEKVGPSAG